MTSIDSSPCLRCFLGDARKNSSFCSETCEELYDYEHYGEDPHGIMFQEDDVYTDELR